VGERLGGARLRGRVVRRRREVPLPGHRSQAGRRPGPAAAARRLEVTPPPPLHAADPHVRRDLWFHMLLHNLYDFINASVGGSSEPGLQNKVQTHISEVVRRKSCSSVN